ncbi:hypothetical protein [Novosphingobium sp. PY1]|uniref:Uncharacterized protein n=1 Tax=Ochrobactrum sp. PW1 TaxID=1882222 RepID=A0A292GMS5_9HYPH|nr:hypothetical protein [Novosphingobium sp. PY1]BBA74413.1 hypothetical protein [Ochrobactrum sp. PW1]GFM29262.1 uncharacterized protein PY1_contig-07-188 [Novosphingobium sp. PY1]
MCTANPMGMLTSKAGRAAALGGIAGTMIAGGAKNKQSRGPQRYGDGTVDPKTGAMS